MNIIEMALRQSTLRQGCYYESIVSLTPTALGVAREKQTLHPSPCPCNPSPSLVSRPSFTTRTRKHVHMTCQHARMCQPPAHTDAPGCQHTLQRAQMRSTRARHESGYLRRYLR